MRPPSNSFQRKASSVRSDVFGPRGCTPDFHRIGQEKTASPKTINHNKPKKIRALRTSFRLSRLRSPKTARARSLQSFRDAHCPRRSRDEADANRLPRGLYFLGVGSPFESTSIRGGSFTHSFVRRGVKEVAHWGGVGGCSRIIKDLIRSCKT